MTDQPQLLDLPDQTIAYVCSPDPASTADPLVLLHGGAVDHRMWWPQLSAFPGRRIVAPDARGHGGSSDATAAYRLADDVVTLLDALGIEEAVLMGISMGGGTAVDVALEYPERVSGLVVSGTGTSEPEFTDPWCLSVFSRWKAAEEQGDLTGWIDAFMRFTAGRQRERADVDPWVWDLVETMARDTVAAHLRVDADGVPVPPIPATPVRRTWERLPGIDVPVLALCGVFDGTDHHRMGRRLAEAVPTGEYTTVPGGAHYPNLENPAAFDDAVREFLARHGL